MDPIDALEKWLRKHYSAEIHLGPSVMPGDEGWVKLSSGYRSVTADVMDFEWSDDEPAPSPSIRELVAEAFRKWKADRRPKRVHMIWWHTSAAGTGAVERYDTKQPVRSWGLDVIAETETDAVEGVERAYRDAGLEAPKVYAWEKEVVDAKT